MIRCCDRNREGGINVSKKTEMNPEEMIVDNRGIREIADTLRRGTRMSPKQFHFSVFIATALILLLILLIIVAQSRATYILKVNESSDVMREAMNAERIELTNKLQLTDRYGTATVDGKHLYVLQEVGQQTGKDSDKLYWLVYCSEEESADYAAAMKSYKQLIPLDVKGGKGLYVAVSQKNALNETKEKLAKKGIEAHFIALDEMGGTPNLEGISEDDQKTLMELLGELKIYNFGYDSDQAIRLSRASKGQIADLDGQKTMLRLIRIAMIVALIAAAVVLTVQLKRAIRDDNAAAAPGRRRIRIIALVAAGVLLAGIMVMSVLINNKDDEMVVVSDLNIATDLATGAADSGDLSSKFSYVIGKGSNAKTVTVSFPEKQGGFAAWRIVYYVSLALLIILLFVLIYYFRYERDLGFPIFNAVILIFLMFLTLYPVLNTVAYSFNDGTDAARGGIGIVPRQFSMDSYKQILTPTIYRAAGISAAKTIITTVLNLFWTGMLAFALSRKEFVLRKLITPIMVITMYVNAGLIPNFLLISKTLGLSDSFWVYIIPTMFSCFNMIIIRTYIVGLPNELVESARIDGAGDLRIYWQIIFPLCAPVLATVALFVAVGAWNSWFDTMLYIPNNRKLDTLQYYLMGKINTAGQQSNLANGSLDAANELARQSVSPRTVQCATTVVTALPILIIYPFLQRYFVTGMALGSVKG